MLDKILQFLLKFIKIFLKVLKYVGIYGGIAFVLLAIFTVYMLFQKIPYKQDTIISVPDKSSISRIVEIFNEREILTPGWLFEFWARLYAFGFGDNYYSGSYKFSPEHNNFDVLRSIFTGEQLYVVKVTFPEGLNLEEIATICEQKLGINKNEFLKSAKSDSLLKAYDIIAESIEGYLMPNTYNFYWMQSPNTIIKRLLDEQNKFWTANCEKIADSLKMSRKEILTLASIIEAETPSKGEMAKVSGVYHNRLRKGMKLEADPTVQYAIGSKKKLTYDDLAFDSPYNTYKYPGLPPGPINNPSKSAILAALKPEQHIFIYFVAIGDGSNKHNFSQDFSSHRKNIEIMRKNRKQ